MSDLFLGFLIAHLQYLKNLVVVLALCFQGVDIRFDGGQGFGGSFSGRNQSFGGTNGLSARGELRGRASRGVTVCCIMACLPAAKAAAFFDTLSTFGGCEFRKGYCVNVHGVRFSLISGGVGKRGGGNSSLL
jgi:hypothetical protein